MDIVKWARKRVRTIHLYDADMIDAEALQDSLNESKFYPGEVMIGVERLGESIATFPVETKVRPIRFVSHGTMVRRASR